VARFDDQVIAVQAHVARARQQGRLRELALDGARLWPSERSFVLARDAAVDLGSPAVGSVGFLVWAPPTHELPPADHVWLEGPDLAELAARGPDPVAFGQVIVVHGHPPDDYEGYLDLKEALYDLALEGVAVRSMPSQSHLWCRIHRGALGDGFGLVQLGAGIIASLRRLEFVAQVDILFHTAGREALAPLTDIAAATERVVGALIKRHEEEHAECDECEYQDVCDERTHPPGSAS
jgi:hypothetical protein